MMECESKNFLYLVWKSPQSRRNFVVGKLTKSKDAYQFEYCEDVEDALKSGFSPLVSFPQTGRVYSSTNMFPVFSSRLPDKKRKGIDEILNKYELDVYDEFELLKKSGARLPIDTFSFVNPIFPADEKIQIEFWAMGVRHYIGCVGEDCKNAVTLEAGQNVRLRQEPDNQYDGGAVQLTTDEGQLIGYLPRYYCQAVNGRLNRSSNYECKVVKYDRQADCQECLKISLKIPV